MSDTWILVVGIVFVLAGGYNARRAWSWQEIPEVLEGREHLIPLQVPGVIFFGAIPIGFALDAVLGHPDNGSSGAIVVGAVAGAVALAGVVLAITAYWFGRPQRLIAPIARGIPRWAPRPHAEP
jgi:hypothetical protein